MLDSFYSGDYGLKIETKSEVKTGLLGGPVLGLQWNTKIWRISLYGDLSQSVLVGNADYSCNLEANYDYFDYDFESTTVKSPYSKKERIAIPVSELKAGLAYNFIDDFISIGLGGFCSIWQNAPLEPNWSFGSSSSSKWRHKKDNYIFAGVFAEVNVYF